MAGSKSWGGLVYRALDRPAGEAGPLFRFTGAWAPSEPSAGWGAWDGERLVAAVLMERVGTAAMLHGPVGIAPGDAGAADPAERAREPLEIAGQLLADVLDHSRASRIDTVFARPQGLDRLWVRFGFIPVPEVELPGDLRGRPGAGLFGWRGGTALWSTASRGAPARASAGR